MYLVCYDITDDRERRRIGKLLEGFGVRVQRSVFECCLTAHGYQEMIAQLTALDIVSGHVAVYLLNKSKPCLCIGKKPEMLVEHDDHAFVI